jgi:hypothetical protein
VKNPHLIECAPLVVRQNAVLYLIHWVDLAVADSVFEFFVGNQGCLTGGVAFKKNTHYSPSAQTWVVNPLHGTAPSLCFLLISHSYNVPSATKAESSK